MTVLEIREAMQFLLTKFDRFYLMIDALNETPYDDEVIETLISLCEQHAKLRVLVTSTREPFRDTQHIFVRRMNEPAINLDIKMYVRQRLQTESRFKWLDPISRNEITLCIITSSDGTHYEVVAEQGTRFRWAKLCMDQLSRHRTVKHMKDALKSIPTTLNETYAAMLSRIAPEDKEIAREALAWLCFSLRPVCLRELAEAVVLREDDTSLDNDARLGDPAVLFEICQGLIYNNEGELTLAHDSIRTFLLSDWIRESIVAEFAVDPASVHRKIMRKCLTYLSLREFASGPVLTQRSLNSRICNYPLLGYASQLWPIHSERFDLQPEDTNDILTFFRTKGNPNSGAFGAWVQLLLGTLDLDTIHRTEPLYYAASYNMVSILKILLRHVSDVDVNKRGGRHSSTPLFVAVWRGNLEAAKLLYKSGADPYLLDNTGPESYRHGANRCHDKDYCPSAIGAEEMSLQDDASAKDNQYPRSIGSRCQFDTLEQCLHPPFVRRELQNLPGTMDATHAQILRRIRPNQLSTAKRLLQFLTYSERPLKLEEAKIECQFTRNISYQTDWSQIWLKDL
ncbi:unnamed protein product [Clonostachys rhizophaga]|uniref:GPI inositol-deacylase winged helix domain-containing protein n=1 Tax=Clonostachys rhizophaga TaxID=160324 RepID=A0A9N9VR21_9HYPO|nr:unnamed protein product [Clonostachys rhizophaga]